MPRLRRVGRAKLGQQLFEPGFNFNKARQPWLPAFQPPKPEKHQQWLVDGAPAIDRRHAQAAEQQLQFFGCHRALQ